MKRNEDMCLIPLSSVPLDSPFLTVLLSAIPGYNTTNICEGLHILCSFFKER